MILRPAQMRDAFLFLDWRNDPAAVANSATQQVINVLDHLPWYQRILTDPTRRVFIAEDDGLPVGYGRLKGLNEPAVELTICVAPEQRGKGYGKYMVGLLVYEAVRAGGTKAWALIKATNVASRCCFEVHRFQPDDVTVPWITYRRSL